MDNRIKMGKTEKEEKGKKHRARGNLFSKKKVRRRVFTEMVEEVAGIWKM